MKTLLALIPCILAVLLWAVPAEAQCDNEGGKDKQQGSSCDKGDCDKGGEEKGECKRNREKGCEQKGKGGCDKDKDSDGKGKGKGGCDK